MASGPPWLDRKTSAAVRSPVAAPPSPHTPQRGISSAFSSPGSGYRVEDELVLLEFGARHLRAGFAGSTWAPKCTLRFGIEESRRVGDYRRWLPGYDPSKWRKMDPHEWMADHELWQLDPRSSDLGLVEDKMERAIREAYSKYLLLEAKLRRVILVVSTSMPHPYLSLILSLLFNNFQVPGVALASPPTMAVLAAGQRSGLVVDVGWHETSVTAIDEFREVYERRNTCAMRTATCQMARLLDRALEGNTPEPQDDTRQGESNDNKIKAHFEYVEEVLTRMAWCNLSRNESLEDSLAKLDIKDTTSEVGPRSDTDVSIPRPSISSPPLLLRFSALAVPIESTFFTPSLPYRQQDDQEQTLALLVYNALLALPPDTRGACMSRIIITGGGSRTPGLKTRLLHELEELVMNRGWDPVWGKAADKHRERLKEIDSNRRATKRQSKELPDIEEEPEDGALRKTAQRPESREVHLPAAMEPQIPDPIEEKLRREAMKGTKPAVSGIVRGIDSMGAWAGASLAAALRVKPVVEIEREQFLQHGLAGAKRDVEVSVANARQSTGPGLSKAGTAEAAIWTLGAWA